MTLRATSVDLEVVPEEDEYWCELCGEEFWESHYHCANCMEVSGQFGHYDAETGRFSCGP